MFLNCECRVRQNGGRVWLFRIVLNRARVYLITNAVLHRHPVRCSASKSEADAFSSRCSRACFSGAEWTQVNWQLPDTSTDLICHAHNPSIKNTHTYFKDGSCLIMHFCSVQTDEKKRKNNLHLTPKDGSFSSRGSPVLWSHLTLQKTENLPLMLLPTVTEGGGGVVGK